MLKREDLKVGETYQDNRDVDIERTVLMIGDECVFYKQSNRSEGIDGERLLEIERFLNINKLIKPEPKIQILYECIDTYGTLALYFEDGHHPNFEEKRKSIATDSHVVTRKTGRTFKLNMDTWEIVNE